MDYASNYPECLLMSDISSVKLISWLEDLFSHYGNPDQLVTDNGPQFMSVEFSNFLISHGIKHVRTAIYNPSQNGLIEVFNRVLKYGVHCFQSVAFQAPSFGLQPGSRWKNGITELLKTYRATPLKSGQKCPAELFFGRPFRLNSQITKEQFKSLVARRIALRGPFAVGDLVLTKRPQAHKGLSPFVGPFRIVEVLERYAYR
ncbi:MAG: transposase family protein, partial [Chloroflexi bacterium]|nr:transposase family protein [Chloroflexota bacterium]